MMKLLSLSRKNASHHESLRWHESETTRGVRYAIRRVSLAQRIELTQRVREVSAKYEFLQAGPTSDQLEASLADLLARKVYIEWGLAGLQGLVIDGRTADLASLIEKGPEALSEEIIGKIRAEIGLSEEEIKNS